MRALLLLLILCCFDRGYVAAASDFDWSDCGEGETAFCQVLPTCNDPKKTGKYYMQEYTLTNKPCSTGVHIKPESTMIWTVSILNKDQVAADPFKWVISSNEIVQCMNKIPIRGNDLPSNIDIVNVFQSLDPNIRCAFKLVSKDSQKLSKSLNDLNVDKESKISFTTPLLFTYVDFIAVDKRVQCKGLFMEPSDCDSSEQCDKPLGNWDCPAHLQTMFREDESSNFTKAKIKCSDGEFSAVGEDVSPLSVGPESKAKCARKKCSLCQSKSDNFTELFQSGNETHCASLRCLGGQFMVLNTTKGDHRGIPAGEDVQCSTVTDPIPAGTGPVPGKQARWHVQNDKEADIEWAVCKDSVPCDLNGVRIHTACAPDEQNCKKADLSADGAYACSEGTMHAEMNGTSEHIAPPKCEDNGQWTLTVYGADNATSSRTWDEASGDLKIKCLLAPVEAAIAPAPASSSWLIVVIVIALVLLVIAIVIGVLYIAKRHKNKQKPVSKASKSSSTATKSSSKPESSAEKEPLTSAMQSVTGDSVHTAIPEGPKQTPPVVLTGADLRPVTAAAQPSTKRDKKSSTSGKKESEKRKRDSKPKSEDSSKNADVTDRKDKLAVMPDSNEDKESLLKSQTGGDGESQVESQKRKAAKNGNPESAKALPQGRGAPRKYRQSGSAPEPKKLNDKFLQLTDSDDNDNKDEPSQTGSKKKRAKL